MEFRSLRYFMAVAKELNFTRAAETLMMSQPPLSNAIKALEQELGAQLFDRSGRRLELTEAGKLLENRAMRIINLVECTERDIRDLVETADTLIRIGLVDGAPNALIMEVLAECKQRIPSFNWRLSHGDSDTMTALLKEGHLDIAVVGFPYDANLLNGFLISREPWGVVMQSDHPLANNGRDYVVIDELIDEPLIFPKRKHIFDEVLGWFKEASPDFTPNIAGSASDYRDVVACARQNLGLGIYLEPDIDALDITFKPLAYPRRMLSHALVWGNEPSAIVADFAESVRRRSSTLVSENLR